VDLENDGFCDSPYQLNSQNFDYLPLKHIKNVTISINLNNSAPAIPEAVLIWGKAILLPDEANITNTNVSIYLNETFLANRTTNSSGFYNFTLQTTSNMLGINQIKVNLTYSGYYGENTTTIEIWAPTNITSYQATQDFFSNPSCAIATIKVENYTRSDTNEPILGEINITIDSLTKTCSGSYACEKNFTVGDYANCEIKPGSKTILINASNSSAFYRPASKSFQIYLEDVTTTATILAYNITVFNVSLSQDKIEQFNFTLNNTGKATMKNISITKYSGPFAIINTTPLLDVPPETLLNLTFNITIPAGTQAGTYNQVYNLTWVENNNYYSQTFSNIQKVTVVGNPMIELSTYNITPTIDHNQTFSINITINNTGNAALLDIWANYSQEDLPKEWVSINPSYWQSIPQAETRNFTVTISIPAGTNPGFYKGNINVTSHLGNPDERFKEIEVNITVPINSSWLMEIYSSNGTKVDFINETFGLNREGLLGNITVKNIGNIPINFSLSYSTIPGYTNPITSGVFEYNKIVGGELFNPTFLFVDKQDENQIKLWQNGYHVVTTFALNLTISNSSAIPSSNSTPFYWYTEDQPPEISNLNYTNEIEIKKLQAISAYYDDDQDQLFTIFLNITLPNSTVQSFTCAQGTYLQDGTHTCNFYPPIEGIYSVNLTACDAGEKCSRINFNFTAMGKTYLEATTNTTSVTIEGITQFNSRTFALNITVKNLNSTVSAYFVNVSSSPPAGTSWTIQDCNLGNISANSSKSCLLNITVPAKTSPSIYSMQPYVKWQNANESLTPTNYTQVVYITIASTRLLNTSLEPSELLVLHGSQNSTWFLINSTGNDEVRSISSECKLSNICSYLSFNPSFINSISAGNFVNVTINISLPKGFTPGNYYPTINSSSSDNTQDSFIFQVIVPQDPSWITDKENVTIKAVVGQNKTINLLNISNLGNLQLDFDFSLEGNITQWMSLKESSSSLAPQQSYTLQANYSTPTSTSFWSGNLTIEEKNYGLSKKIPIKFEVYKANLTIHKPTQSNPYIQLLPSQIININSTLTLMGETITNQTEFQVLVDSSECNITSYANINSFWLVNCSLPSLQDGRWHNLTLKAHYLPYDMWVEVEEMNTLYYKDLTPPQFTSKEIPSVEYPQSLTIKLNLTDNVEIHKATVFVQQLNQMFELTTNDGITWGYTFVGLQPNDYDLIFTINDTTGNIFTFSDYFEVYTSRLLSGNITNALEEGINATFKFYRNSTQRLLHNFTTVKGYYNAQIHNRIYDLEISAQDFMATIFDLNASALPNDFIKIDLIPAAETNLVNSVNGVAFNTTLTNKAKIKIYYSQNTLITYGLSEDYLKVFACYHWIWNQRSCNSSDSWHEISDYSINKLHNYIEFNVSSFSGNPTGYAAYIIAEKRPAGYVCGDGVCSTGETPYTCPEDCGQPQFPTYTPTYSTPSIPMTQNITEIINKILEELGKLPKDRIAVSERTLSLSLYQGESLKIRVKVKNQMEERAIFEIRSSGEASNFISFMNPKISLNPSEEDEFSIIFLIPHEVEARLYTGSLIISSGTESVEIPVNLRVLSTKEELLDIRVVPLKDEVAPGYSLPVEVTLYNLGKTSKVDVDLLLDVFDVDRGKSLTSKKEVLAVQTSLSRIFYLEIPKDVEEKRYMLRATAAFSYFNRTVGAESHAFFTVKIPLVFKSFFGLLVWQWIVLGGTCSFGTLATTLIYRQHKLEEKRKRRYRVLLETRTLPTETPDSAFIGNLAETGTRAFVHLKDLATHVMVAGATGSGKTISAMVLVEEALMKGKSVIVFDPTAQWTGFLRKCKEKDMLEKYKFFGLTEQDARAFKGRIKVVEHPRQMIDLKEIILGKEPQIVIFTLTKLDPKDIDIFVANTIEQVFRARLPESRDLRCLMVYDEVHRLLPKFGGSGKGFLALERGVREFRKWGIGLILISQVISDFVGEIKANIGMEIQMRTRYDDDLDRISRKYGKEIEVSITKAAVGTGMLVFSEYNRGRPYFITFRPILHQVSRLSDEELERYVEYDKRLEKTKFLVNVLKNQGVDVFDLETEISLCESKLMEGAFDIVDIYLEGLEPRIKGEFEKRGMKIPEYKPELLEEKEIERIVEEAEKEREKFLENFKKEISIEYLKETVEKIKKMIKEAKAKGIDTFTYEIDLERIPAEIKILEISKEVKGMQDLAFKLNNMEKEIEKLIKREKK